MPTTAATPGADAPRAASIADLGALFDAHAPALLRLVERLTGRGAHVEDIVQDIFLIAHRRHEAASAAISPRAWLYGVALNLCRNERRRDGRRHHIAQRYDVSVTGPPPLDPEAATQRAEIAATLRACLATLPVSQREVVVLYELEGLEGAAIAAILGIPLNTVWTRLRAGRDKLRRLLRRRGFRPGDGS